MRRHLDDVDRDAFAADREERDRHREPRRAYPRWSLARRWAFQAWVIDTVNQLAARSPGAGDNLGAERRAQLDTEGLS